MGHDVIQDEPMCSSVMSSIACCCKHPSCWSNSIACYCICWMNDNVITQKKLQYKRN